MIQVTRFCTKTGVRRHNDAVVTIETHATIAQPHTVNHTDLASWIMKDVAVYNKGFHMYQIDDHGVFGNLSGGTFEDLMGKICEFLHGIGVKVEMG